jgi:hypothetical protein
MDFADHAEDLAGDGRDGPDAVDAAEDLAGDTEDFAGDTADFGADDVEADAFAADGFHAEESGAQDFHTQQLTATDDDAADEAGAGFGEVPGEPAELRPSTGEPRVDAALARLDELKGRPVTEHRAVFEDVHRRLRDVLGELDSRQQQPSRDATDAADAAGRPGR